jgi:hemoglobin-like flavoprotein
MSPTQLDAIRETFALVALQSDVAARAFYERLFELDPSLRPLFRSDLEEQGRKLMQMLGAAVRLLDNPQGLTPVLENLGRRHSEYGVRDEHYDTVGEALLSTLSAALGELFTPVAREAWASLYGLVATTMQRAARHAAPTTCITSPDVAPAAA